MASADELDRPRGWDDVIDCTGVVAAIEDGLPRVIKGGTFQQFGVANEDAHGRFSPFVVYNQEIRIVGSMAVLHSFDRAAQLLAEGVLRPDVMISDRKPLDDYPAALEQFRAGVGRKIQVTPTPDGESPYPMTASPRFATPSLAKRCGVELGDHAGRAHVTARRWPAGCGGPTPGSACASGARRGSPAAPRSSSGSRAARATARCRAGGRPRSCAYSSATTATSAVHAASRAGSTRSFSIRRSAASR